MIYQRMGTQRKLLILSTGTSNRCKLLGGASWKNSNVWAFFLANINLHTWRDIKIHPKSLPHQPPVLLAATEAVASISKEKARWQGCEVPKWELPQLLTAHTRLLWRMLSQVIMEDCMNVTHDAEKKQNCSISLTHFYERFLIRGFRFLF